MMRCDEDDDEKDEDDEDDVEDEDDDLTCYHGHKCGNFWYIINPFWVLTLLVQYTLIVFD